MEKSSVFAFIIGVVITLSMTVNCESDVCPSDPELIVFLPSDEFCDKYYICVKGQPMAFWCATGLHWNQDAETCDFPHNVNCKIEKQFSGLGPVVMNQF